MHLPAVLLFLSTPVLTALLIDCFNPSPKFVLPILVVPTVSGASNAPE
jgi:hypothetical protein